MLVAVVVVLITMIVVAVLSMNVFAMAPLLLHHLHSLLLHGLFLDVLDKLGNSHACLFSILGNPSLNLSDLLGCGTLARHGHGDATLRTVLRRRR
jgi:hypothetical protein